MHCHCVILKMNFIYPKACIDTNSGRVLYSVYDSETNGWLFNILYHLLKFLK